MERKINYKLPVCYSYVYDGKQNVRFSFSRNMRTLNKIETSAKQFRS